MTTTIYKKNEFNLYKVKMKSERERNRELRVYLRRQQRVFKSKKHCKLSVKNGMNEQQRNILWNIWKNTECEKKGSWLKSNKRQDLKYKRQQQQKPIFSSSFRRSMFVCVCVYVQIATHVWNECTGFLLVFFMSKSD